MGFIGTKKGVIHWIFLHYHGGKVDKSGADVWVYSIHSWAPPNSCFSTAIDFDMAQKK